MLTPCPNCGTPNRAVAKFCKKCVQPLGAGDADALPDEAAFDEAAHAPTQIVARAGTQPAPGALGTQLIGRPPPRDHALPRDTLIEGFRIVRKLGEGGFGIVYLAWDAALQRHVALKEYMPSSLAVRAEASFHVSMRSERDRETFDAGLKSFVNEARLLARFDHPALVKVFRFWEGNGTAYMAMPYYEGPTLKSALARLGGRPTEAQVREWLDPLLDAVAAMHRENCFHRDISPDNILLTPAGPVLLDFGAARHVISDMTQALTAMLKPGFAPIEQYGGDMLQGPWTDIYALGGVVHYALTGAAPVASVQRMVKDTLVPLATRLGGQYAPSFLSAVDTSLALRPEARPQGVAQFRALLGAVVPGVADLATPPAPAASAADSLADLPATPAAAITPARAAPETVPATGVRPEPAAARSFARATPGASTEASIISAPPRRPRPAHWAAALAGCGAVAVAAATWWGPTAADGPAAAPAPSAIAMPQGARTAEAPAAASPPSAPPATPATPTSADAGRPADAAPSMAAGAPAATRSAAVTAPAPSAPGAPSDTAEIVPPLPADRTASTAAGTASSTSTAGTAGTASTASTPGTPGTPGTATAASAAPALATVSAPAPGKSPGSTAPRAATNVARTAAAPRAQEPGRAQTHMPTPAHAAIVRPASIETVAQAALPSAPAERTPPSRCGFLVLKSSLQPLAAEELAFLKQECR